MKRYASLFSHQILIIVKISVDNDEFVLKFLFGSVIVLVKDQNFKL